MKQNKKTILLIEDEVMLNDAFTTMLTKNGFEVVSVFNGQEALDSLKTLKPDAILLDLLMPVMDGKEFLTKFKNSASIPIIIFSNLDAKSDVQGALQLGATRYMLKAWVTPKGLVRVINDVV